MFYTRMKSQNFYFTMEWRLFNIAIFSSLTFTINFLERKLPKLSTKSAHLLLIHNFRTKSIFVPWNTYFYGNMYMFYRDKDLYHLNHWNYIRLNMQSKVVDQY
jgi:hypothetical protein